MMKSIFPLICLSSLVFCAPALAQEGFDAASVRAYLEKKMVIAPKVKASSTPDIDEDDERLLKLSLTTVLFRVGAILCSTTTEMVELDQVTPGSCKVFQGNKISSKFPIIWPYVVGGSFLTVGNALSDTPIAALYNPYFDVVILTRWRLVTDDTGQKPSVFKIIEAVPVVGRAFRADRAARATDTPSWSDSKAPLFEFRIAEAAQSFVAAFEKRYPPLGRKSAVLSTEGVQHTIEQVESGVFALIKWVIDAQTPSAPVNYAAEIKQLRAALAASKPDQLEKLLPADNIQTAASFFGLDDSIRAGMRPYVVADTNVIFLDSISLPMGFISVHYKQEAKGYSVGAMNLFGLLAPYPAK